VITWSRALDHIVHITDRARHVPRGEFLIDLQVEIAQVIRVEIATDRVVGEKNAPAFA
jgi:hypothetical protein